MQGRPPEELKPLATELSCLIHSRHPDANRIAQLEPLFFNGSDPGVKDKIKMPKPTNGVHRIGIWKQLTEGDRIVFERDLQRQPEWHLWADVPRISLERGRKRILLTGESVARGYFYDPFYTVAQELEGILAAVPGFADCNVVDLARTSINMSGLKELLSTCNLLEPHAVIIFAGNNWHTEFEHSLGAEDYRQLYALFRKHSFASVRSFLENRLALFVRAFLEKIHADVIQKGIPALFIIPGFNLKDWKSDAIEQIIPRLPEELGDEWLLCRKTALEALGSCDMDQLETAAKRMTEIDISNPYGFELLAEAYLHRQQYADARRCLELAMDSTLISRGINSKPRCFSVIRETIRASANELGIHVIDVSGIMGSVIPSGIPGREFFLDYCHLTVDGIKLVMRHTAQALIRLFTGRQVPISAVQASPRHPVKEVEAMAHFCAAIHNAHYGQTAGILDHHCSKAVSCADSATEIMQQYADFATRHASTVFCSAFTDAILSGKLRQYEGGLALAHARDNKMMDADLVNAIILALRSKGIEIEEKITALRIKEHGVGAQGTDLMKSYYSNTFYNNSSAEPKPLFSQVRTPIKQVLFVAAGSEPMSFKIVYRTPGPREEGAIQLFLNDPGNPVAIAPMSRNWKTFSFTIDGQRIRRGINRLYIQWPYVSPPLPAETDLSSGYLFRIMFPVLGDLYALSVSPANKEKY